MPLYFILVLFSVMAPYSVPHYLFLSILDYFFFLSYYFSSFVNDEDKIKKKAAEIYEISFEVEEEKNHRKHLKVLLIPRTREYAFVMITIWLYMYYH